MTSTPSEREQTVPHSWGGGSRPAPAGNVKMPSFSNNHCGSFGGFGSRCSLGGSASSTDVKPPAVVPVCRTPESPIIVFGVLALLSIAPIGNLQRLLSPGLTSSSISFGLPHSSKMQYLPSPVGSTRPWYPLASAQQKGLQSSIEGGAFSQLNHYFYLFFPFQEKILQQ